jgi:hypothetical protein
LHIASRHFALVAKAIAVLDRARKHIRNRLDPAMRMPGKSREVILWMLVAEVIKQQKRIEVLSFAEAEGALKLYPGALDGGLGLNDLFDWTERHIAS